MTTEIWSILILIYRELEEGNIFSTVIITVTFS